VHNRAAASLPSASCAIGTVGTRHTGHCQNARKTHRKLPKVQTSQRLCGGSADHTWDGSSVADHTTARQWLARAVGRMHPAPLWPLPWAFQVPCPSLALWCLWGWRMPASIVVHPPSSVRVSTAFDFRVSCLRLQKRAPTHPLTHSPTHLLTHSFIHLLTCSHQENNAPPIADHTCAIVKKVKCRRLPTKRRWMKTEFV